MGQDKLREVSGRVLMSLISFHFFASLIFNRGFGFFFMGNKVGVKLELSVGLGSFLPLQCLRKHDRLFKWSLWSCVRCILRYLFNVCTSSSRPTPTFALASKYS